MACGNLGFFGVLHIWGQPLWHHPHVHFIIAGEISQDQTLWTSGKWSRPIVL